MGNRPRKTESPGAQGVHVDGVAVTGYLRILPADAFRRLDGFRERVMVQLRRILAASGSSLAGHPEQVGAGFFPDQLAGGPGFGNQVELHAPVCAPLVAQRYPDIQVFAGTDRAMLDDRSEERRV